MQSCTKGRGFGSVLRGHAFIGGALSADIIAEEEADALSAEIESLGLPERLDEETPRFEAKICSNCDANAPAYVKHGYIYVFDPDGSLTQKIGPFVTTRDGKALIGTINDGVLTAEKLTALTTQIEGLDLPERGHRQTPLMSGETSPSRS